MVHSHVFRMEVARGSSSASNDLVCLLRLSSGFLRFVLETANSWPL